MAIKIKKITDTKKNFIDKLRNKVILKVGFLNSKMAEIAIKTHYGGVFPITEEYHNRALARGIPEEEIPTQLEIPPRPFLNYTVHNYGGKWGRQIQKALKKYEYDQEKALAILGELIVGQIQRTIRNTDWIDNGIFAQEVKGFNRPLIDRGDMLRSIAYEIKK